VIQPQPETGGDGCAIYNLLNSEWNAFCREIDADLKLLLGKLKVTIHPRLWAARHVPTIDGAGDLQSYLSPNRVLNPAQPSAVRIICDLTSQINLASGPTVTDSTYRSHLIS